MSAQGLRVEAVNEAQLREALEEWGREYRLGREPEIGWGGHGVMARMIEFGGRIPIATGYKPLPENKIADAVEFAVNSLAAVNMRCAICLRAFYCGRGRIVDKREIAEELSSSKMSNATFKHVVRQGEMYVAGRIGL